MKIIKISLLITLAIATSAIARTKGLYEMVIANDTTELMHWHMKTSGKDKNGDIKPGDAYSFNTSNIPQRLTITFKKSGQKQQKRGYPIPSKNALKDWVFGVSGKPFEGPWSVCGSWAHTRLQSQATLAAEIVGLAAGSAVLAYGGLAAGGAAVVAAGSTSIPLLTGAMAGGAAAGAAVAAGTIGSTIGDIKSNLGLSRQMHKDKCYWYGK